MKALKLKAQRVRSAPFCGGSLKAVAVFVAALLVPVSASLLAQSPSPAAQSQSEAVDVTALKAQLAEQQKQIDQLKSALQEQMKMLERVSNSAAGSRKSGNLPYRPTRRRSVKSPALLPTFRQPPPSPLR